MGGMRFRSTIIHDHTNFKQISICIVVLTTSFTYMYETAEELLDLESHLKAYIHVCAPLAEELGDLVPEFLSLRLFLKAL